MSLSPLLRVKNVRITKMLNRLLDKFCDAEMLPDGVIHFTWGLMHLLPYERYVKIESIWVKSKLRSRGYARATLDILCTAADESNVVLKLRCHRFGDLSSKGPTTKELCQFYEKFGFKTGHEDVMTRAPKK